MSPPPVLVLADEVAVPPHVRRAMRRRVTVVEVAAEARPPRSSDAFAGVVLSLALRAPSPSIVGRGVPLLVLGEVRAGGGPLPSAATWRAPAPVAPLTMEIFLERVLARRRRACLAERLRRAALPTLDEACLMHFARGLTTDQVAARLGLSPASAAARLHRAQQALGGPTVAELRRWAG